MAELELKAARPGTVRWRRENGEWKPKIGRTIGGVLFEEAPEARAKESTIERIARLGRELLLGESFQSPAYAVESTGVLGDEVPIAQGGPTLVNPNNRAALLRALQRGVAKQLPDYPPAPKQIRLANAAIEYVKTKYPTLFSLANKVRATHADPGESAHGMTDFLGGQLNVRIMPDTFTEGNSGNKVEQMVNSILHELRHVASNKGRVTNSEMPAQYARFANDVGPGGDPYVNPYAAMYGSAANKLRSSGVSEKEISDLIFTAYANQPEELLARRAGTTAANTLNKLMSSPIRNLTERANALLAGDKIW